MTYETLRSIYVITGIACLVMAALTVGLFFLLRIPEALAFVTGQTQKKSIEAIRKTGTVSATPVGKKAKPAKRAAPVKKTAPAVPVAPPVQKGTEVLPKNERATEVLDPTNRLTTVLGEAVGTGTLETVQTDHPNLVFTQQPFVLEVEITYVSSDVVIGEGCV